MEKNGFFKIIIIILISLTLGGVVALVLVNQLKDSDPNAEPTIDEIVANSFETEEITTNLLSNDYIKTSFQIHANTKKGAQELKKRDFQVNNIIIRTLSGMDSSDLTGPEGINKLEIEIRDQINEVMQTGKVLHVYTTILVIQ